MKTANEFDDQESVPVPDNHVLAIVRDSDEARAIVETLNANGFSPEEIGILTGTADAEKLVSCPLNKRYIAGGRLAVFQGGPSRTGAKAPVGEPYGSSEQRGKTANRPLPRGLR